MKHANENPVLKRNSQSRTVRLFERTTRTHWMSIEDALAIQKVRFFVGQYANGKAQQYIGHYVDVPAMLYLLQRLMHSPTGLVYKEFKGSDKGGNATSRVMEVKVKEGRGELVVYWDFKEGPGKKTGTGAIQPAGPTTAVVSLGMPLKEAQMMAAYVWSQLQASFVLRAWVHRQELPTMPLLFAPAKTDVGLGIGEDSVSQREEARKGVKNTAIVEATQLFGVEVLVYGDDDEVNMGNAAEVKAFKGYFEKNDCVPASKNGLRKFYYKNLAL